MNSSVLFSSVSVVWSTPKALFDHYNSIYHFEWDLAALPSNALCEKFYSPVEDSLSQFWCGSCWLNPPYGRDLYSWVYKACHSPDSLVVMLLPARTDTRWFHDLVIPFASSIEFIRGRLHFNGASDPAPFPSMVVVFNNLSNKG